MNEVLESASLGYDTANGIPNIEVIADHVYSHALSTGQPRFHVLELRLRDLVTDVILGVRKPSLDLHVAFLKALKRRTFGQPVCVYIFTTNYDLLFELAGAEAGVVVETGFIGSVERYFDPQRFGMACGTLHPQNRFTEHSTLTIRLIKLHGSISWIERDRRFFERHPDAIRGDRRVMILPRRRKVMDTLQAPHDALFTAARSALGSNCKYLVSCGFSFSDDHINDNLLLPAVSSGRIRLFALSESETEGMKVLKHQAAFSAGFSVGGVISGASHRNGTDRWMFSSFVKMF